MTSRRHLQGIAGVLVALLVAGACAPSAAPAASPSAVATAAPTPSVSTEKLTIIQDNVIDSLDAHVAQRNQANMVIQRINEPLVKRDPKTLVPGPNLATSWKVISPTVWEFKIRTGVSFTDGQPFNATVVKYNFDRIMDTKLNAAKGASFRSIVDKVEAVDAETVRLTTKAPYALLLERLVAFWMVPQNFDPKKPVGTGPYKFVDWVSGQSVTLERNDAYWGNKGTFRTLEYRQILESATAIAELLSENALVAFGVTPDQVDAVKRDGKAQVYVDQGVDVVEIRMDVNARGGPNVFTDKRVRQAAAYAIDKEAIAKNLLGGYSTVVATNIVPKMFGHDPNVKPYPYDPNKAKQLLTEAGHANGVDVRLMYFPVSGMSPDVLKQLAEAVANDLRKVGIRANLFSVGAAEVSQYTTTGKAGPIFIGGNPNGGFYDGGFGFFFLKKTATSSYFWSDELDKMIAVAEQSPNTDERKQSLSKVQQYLREESPYIWGWTGFTLVGHSQKLDMSDVFIASDFRAENIKPKR